MVTESAPQSFGDCVSCDGYILLLSEAPHCPSCARLKREKDARGDALKQECAERFPRPDDLIDAGLTPKSGTAVAAAMRADEADDEQSRQLFIGAVAKAIGRTGISISFLEAPYERAAHALLDAVGETGIAIFTAPTREDVLEFRDTLEAAIGKLMAQSVAAQTLAANWDERGNK